MPLTTTPKPPAAPVRRIGLPIAMWLVLGFALVIGAFAAASVVSLRSTRNTTADLARMQQQFEPLSRNVRDLGDGLATFDRAVLAYLRADTLDNRVAAVASAERLSSAANRTEDVGVRPEAGARRPAVATNRCTTRPRGSSCCRRRTSGDAPSQVSSRHMRRSIGASRAPVVAVSWSATA